MTATAQISVAAQDLKDAAYIGRVIAAHNRRHRPIYLSVWSPARCQAYTELLRLPKEVGAGLPSQERAAAKEVWLDRRIAELEASGELSEEFQPRAFKAGLRRVQDKIGARA